MPARYHYIQACVDFNTAAWKSDVASMEQMEQLLPRERQGPHIIRADPRRFEGEGVEGSGAE